MEVDPRSSSTSKAGKSPYNLDSDGKTTITTTKSTTKIEVEIQETEQTKSNKNRIEQTGTIDTNIQSNKHTNKQ